MDSRTLEINVMSARDLNKVNLIMKMDVYVIVSISGGDKKSKQKTKTPVDNDGDSNPTWNFPMKFTVEEVALNQNRLNLVFKLVCQRARGDKDVGEVHVPLKELLESPKAADGGWDGKQQKFGYTKSRADWDKVHKTRPKWITEFIPIAKVSATPNENGEDATVEIKAQILAYYLLADRRTNFSSTVVLFIPKVTINE
ncbi:SRC2-like [Olea europaea subsp. europaea]|uniref:SRC2-like n=1 Tax=Olea europaea subsp. europaea TaxID=158383 RepID=A0A8S0UAS5_OLEEU|nr:SRC2-like [Olea europaea subsp. europaea]